jgi:hypothetical protein
MPGINGGNRNERHRYNRVTHDGVTVGYHNRSNVKFRCATRAEAEQEVTDDRLNGGVGARYEYHAGQHYVVFPRKT